MTIKPIRVHPTDQTDADVRARHEMIEKRLEELGENRVAMMLQSGGLPTEWNTIAHAWLAGDKLETIPWIPDESPPKELKT